MSISEGSLVYELGYGACVAYGRKWDDQELQDSMQDAVPRKLHNLEGREKTADLMSRIFLNVQDTSFNLANVEKNLPEKIEPWRVGEAIAVAYLSFHCDCLFPWPSSQDSSNPNAIATGADLVGFQKDKNGDSFVFGEVKTSHQDKYPPDAVSGPKGLTKQLLAICNMESKRKSLVIYLAERAEHSEWFKNFESASLKYYSTEAKTDFQICGFLIRDVQPNTEDLSSTLDEISKIQANETNVKLFALYIPEDSIEQLPEMAEASQLGDAR